MNSAHMCWTGHALIDVGVAGICAFTKRKRPEDVTLEDLDKASEFMVETYYQKKLGCGPNGLVRLGPARSSTSCPTERA